MPEPLAVFMTWTTYGTCLPGDPRGYVSNTRKPDGHYERRQNVPGTPFTADDPRTFQRAQILMQYPRVVLNRDTAHWAAEGLIIAAGENDWRIVRGAVMATHVHVVLPLLDHKTWWVQKILKGRSSRHMSDQQGKTWRWWTRGGRKDVLFTDASMRDVMRYIENQEHILIRIADNQIVAAWPAESQG